jgi:hypothetical protein
LLPDLMTNFEAVVKPDREDRSIPITPPTLNPTDHVIAVLLDFVKVSPAASLVQYLGVVKAPPAVVALPPA